MIFPKPNPATTNKLGTTFTQINLGKHMNASATLLKELKSTDICAIQEPHTRKNGIPSMPKSHKQFTPHSKDKVRVALLLPQDLAKHAMSLSSFNSRDSIVLRVRITSSLTILLASIYMDITQQIPEHNLTRLSNYAESEALPLIICTDSNAHHTAWGSPHCNTRGRVLCPAINSNNLIICNT